MTKAIMIGCGKKRIEADPFARGMNRLAAVSWRGLGLCLVFFGLVAIAGTAVAEDPKEFVAQLVWGTDGARPDGENLSEVDKDLEKRLRGIFKWKNYFEVKRVKFSAPKKQGKKITMSDRCRIEFRDLGDSWVEVKLYGKKKGDSKEEMVVLKKQKLPPGELLVLAGDDINDTAWFVVLRSPGK